MYAILWWEGDYLTFIHNENGSIKLFSKLEEAEVYANELDPKGERSRVISIMAEDN